MKRGMSWFGVFFLLVWGLPVLACGGSTPATATPTKTPTVMAASAPAEGAAATPAPVVEVAAATPEPATATPEPPTATPASMPGLVIPVNQVIDLAGVVITLVDVTFWPGDSLEGEELRGTESFANAQVVGALQVVIENTRSEKATVHADQGTLVVGSEQIELSSTMFFSDDLGGEMFPGVRKHGDAVFALNNVSYEVLHGLTLIYEVGGPRNPDTFESFAEGDYLFQVTIP